MTDETAVVEPETPDVGEGTAPEDEPEDEEPAGEETAEDEPTESALPAG